MLIEHFSAAVRRLEINTGGAIAATLILNTERLLVDHRDRIRRLRTQERAAAAELFRDFLPTATPAPTLPTVTISLALQDLSPDDRHLVGLLLSGFSAHELAPVLHTTEAAIWKRVERIRSAVRLDDIDVGSRSPKKSTKPMSGNPRGHRL